MKKLSALLLSTASLFMVAGCSSTTGVVEGDSSGFSREVVTVGGEKFDCIFEGRNFQHATMSCLDLEVKALKGESDTKGFSREVITSGAEQFDCIFEGRNFQHATMDCFKIEK